jgi:hypothetical protein
MKYDVFRYRSGVTTAHVHDPRMIASALAHPNVLGLVEGIEAKGDWDAIDKGKERFLTFDYTLTPTGRILCEQLLARQPSVEPAKEPGLGP